MFKKGPDIDKKKLLAKASDVKKDSLTRLKHFKTLIEHLEFNELLLLFRSHFSFIYHTFIDTFSTFDCNSKQRRDDLDCILFMLEKILIYNPELVKKRWQFYSITFVMQKLLHQNNACRLRQEGVRLFVLWYQILCDETNVELQTMFGSIVPGIVPPMNHPVSSPSPNSNTSVQHSNSNQNPLQIPIKLCSIDPLVPMSANDQLPSDETSFYLDCLLQYMVTQTTKPHWGSADEARKNQELSFSFMFNMFKKIYLQPLFPNFNSGRVSDPKSYFSNHSIHKYVDEVNNEHRHSRGHIEDDHILVNTSSPKSKRDLLHIDLRQSNYLSPVDMIGHSHGEHERLVTLSHYQSIVIRWLTRILRQDMIPGQDELIKPGSSAERRDFPTGYRDTSSGLLQDQELSYASDGNSTTLFQNMETTSKEMEIARRVAGTWPENIAVVHELFRRAFLNYFQPASMKRVVNVYKEWICNGGSSQTGTQQAKSTRLGYTSFGDLLQVFVLNSSNAFVSKVHNATMLDEQVEMCKRIMNIYRYMVMKIYMNTATWEQLLNVMLSITEQLFLTTPPEKKETTIGGRIAPAFFQTFIVSWIRANLYVHISNQMWNEFHHVMKNLIRWRELIEEWSTTMGSLTRVLVKHVYGLSLTDLPLEKPLDRRRRPRALKSFSTAETTVAKQTEQNPSSSNAPNKNIVTDKDGLTKGPRSGPIRPEQMNTRDMISRRLTRSNSDGIMLQKHAKLYHSSLQDAELTIRYKMRKIKSEYLILYEALDILGGCRSNSPSHNDVIDGSSLKDPTMIIDNDHVIESQPSNKSLDSTKGGKKIDPRTTSDKCVLLGGSVRGWTPENSVIMWRRMLGLFGNINHIEDPENHLVAIKCLAVILCDFIKTRENLGISVDHQSTPDHPSLIPPYTYHVGWLLEATRLPKQFKESCLTAYKLLCLMSIRRHDVELSQQYYIAFYEALYRGLNSNDPQIHMSIIKNSTQLLSLELPGCTFLVQDLYEKSRSILLNSPKDISVSSFPRDQAIQILGTILALHRPIKKLLVSNPEISNSTNLVTSGDIRAKVFDTFLACNMHPVVLDCQTRSRSLSAMTIHVYQELCDKYDSFDIEKLFDTLLTDLQDQNNSNLFRNNCDLLRLFAEHASSLAQKRPALVSSLIQIVCQLIVRLSTNEKNKESIHCLLICLEDWCLSLSKNYLLRSVNQLSTEEGDTLSTCLSESLITIVLRSLENVIHEEQYLDDLSTNKVSGGSTGNSKGSDAHSSSQVSQHGFDSNLNGSRDRTITNDSHLSQQNNMKQQDTQESNNLKAIRLACQVSHQKLSTYLSHFPLKQVGAASMSCCVNEADYLSNNSELNDLKNVSDVTLLIINETTIISFLGSSSSGNIHSPCPIHLIVRNLCGKYSWDATCIEPQTGGKQATNEPESDSIVVDPDSFQQDESRASMKYDSDFNDDGNSGSSISSRTSANRDHIGDLLNQLSSLITTNNSSTNTSHSSYKKRNTAQSISNAKYRFAQAEETMIALLTNQRFQELNYCERSGDLDRVVLQFGYGKLSGPSSVIGEKHQATNENDCNQSVDSTHLKLPLSFEQCRQLILQLGYLAWEKRSKVDMLTKSARLLRELKNLDSQSSRETHKLAVFYVANGQEDKNSILSNSSGSKAFDDFVAGLGWEVNLSSHLGFRGGLQSNKSTGETSPYYCNSTTEVMFHVSTRIPINGTPDDESLNRKLRHLGNDEVHIVWSEHTRDYRRGIIPTEFGDVIIAIYPMLTFLGYYRIQVLSKQDVPLFGPLYDNCIIHQASLASLVRATAINASRAKRFKLPYYQSHFEERSRLINTIVQNHKDKQSFEDFAVQLYPKSSAIRENQNQDSSSCYAQCLKEVI